MIAFPGRKGPQRQARMLARHGYGVLLFDRRGEGAQRGRAEHAGAGAATTDIKAAVAYLQRRADVDPERIGGIGLSVGGEMMIEAAAETHDAGRPSCPTAPAPAQLHEVTRHARGLLDKLDSALAGRRGQDGRRRASSPTAPPPADLTTLAARIAPRPLLLIADRESGHIEELNQGYYRAAGESRRCGRSPAPATSTASAPIPRSTSSASSPSSTAPWLS